MGQITVNLPCKIGDTCWAVKRTAGGKRIFQTVVSEMYFDFHMNLIVVGRRVCRGHIGKDIFMGFQEAHEYLVNENRKEEKLWAEAALPPTSLSPGKLR